MGEVEVENKVLILKRIHVRYRLVVPDEQREVAERSHRAHARHCPVHQSITPTIQVTTELEMVAP